MLTHLGLILDASERIDYVYLGWKDGVRQKPFFCSQDGSRIFLFSAQTQIVEIPRENKNNSLKFLLFQTSSFQPRYT